MYGIKNSESIYPGFVGCEQYISGLPGDVLPQHVHQGLDQLLLSVVGDEAQHHGVSREILKAAIKMTGLLLNHPDSDCGEVPQLRQNCRHVP